MTSCWVNLDEILPGVDILGRLGAHWSFFLDTGASVMEGCRWQDNEDGSFTSVSVLDGFSELDEYLLGLRPASEVGAMFVIDDPSPEPEAGDESFPFPGFTTWGTRVDFTVEDIIAQNGPRIPDASQARHDFRMAFVLVIPEGTTPPPGDLDFLDQFRLDWEEFFLAETDSVGTMETSIPRVPVSVDFAAERIAGNAPLAVEFHDRSTGTILGREWDFDDGGETSFDPDPIHTFPAAGDYNVTLTVDGEGGPSTETRSGFVLAGGFQVLQVEDFENGTAGWSVGAPDDAADGNWEFGNPEGTEVFGVNVQPEDDFTPDGELCWVTGPFAGGFPADNDVDGGTTTLYSPIFDLSFASDSFVSYARWYSNYLGANSEEDVFLVEISADGGNTWLALETLESSDTRWHTVQFRILDFVIPTHEVQFRFLASDLGSGSLVEAAIDDFEILDRPGSLATEPDVTTSVISGASLSVSPNPFAGGTAIRYQFPGAQAISLVIYDTAGRMVRTLVEAGGQAGSSEIFWDGTNHGGRPVVGGVYTARLETASSVLSRKLVKVH
jgi:PKD repeat protein